MAKANERDRFKYGVCTNRDKEGKPCPKNESKEIQKIRIGQDFVCEECKEPLRQVPPPKAKTPMGMIIGIIIGAIVIIGVVIVLLMSKHNTPVIPPQSPVADIDTTTVIVKGIDSIAKESVAEPEKIEKTGKKKNPQPVNPGGGIYTATISVNGGSYTGEVKNGKPDGEGTLTYNRHTRISMKDMKERYAEPGQYITGAFYEGELVHGTLYDTSNKAIENIRIGR
jgi:hypothetical protein